MLAKLNKNLDRNEFRARDLFDPYDWSHTCCPPLAFENPGTTLANHISSSQQAMSSQVCAPVALVNVRNWLLNIKWKGAPRLQLELKIFLYGATKRAGPKIVHSLLEEKTNVKKMGAQNPNIQIQTLNLKALRQQWRELLDLKCWGVLWECKQSTVNFCWSKTPTSFKCLIVILMKCRMLYHACYLQARPQELLSPTRDAAVCSLAKKNQLHWKLRRYGSQPCEGTSTTFAH